MKLLIVVDMQNDFLRPFGSLNLGHDTTALISNVAKYIENFDGTVIATKDYHLKEDEDVEFKMFPPHCIAETEGSDIVKEVKEQLDRKNATIVHKKSFSCTDLNLAIPPALIKTIEVVGVCIHICVHDVIGQVANTFKNKLNILPKITIHRDMVDDFDPEMAEYALKRMKNLYGVEVL